MKINNVTFIILLLYSLVNFGCDNRPTSQDENLNSKQENIANKSDLQASRSYMTWVEHYRIFRDALYAGDKKVVRQYVSEGMAGSDFYGNFYKIFPVSFINSVIKIVSEKLYQNGYYSAQTINYKGSNCQTTGTVENDLLKLNFSSRKMIDLHDGEPPFESGGNLIYTFKITEDQRLLLIDVQLAGGSIE